MEGAQEFNPQDQPSQQQMSERVARIITPPSLDIAASDIHRNYVLGTWQDDEEDEIEDMVSSADPLGSGVRFAEQDIRDTYLQLSHPGEGETPQLADIRESLRRQLVVQLIRSPNSAFLPLIGEYQREKGIGVKEKREMLQVLEDSYEKKTDNKIQSIDPELIAQKIDVVFADDRGKNQVLGPLKEVLIVKPEAGQDAMNRAVKSLVKNEIEKAQSEGRKIENGDLAPEALRFFQVVKDGVANPDDIKYLLGLTYDMTNETQSKPSDLPYMAAKVLLNETQDLELGDQVMEIALRAVEMVFSENPDDYQELENNGSNKGQLLIFAEDFFEKRRREIASSAKGIDLTKVNKLFNAFTEFKNKKVDEQREELIEKLKIEAAKSPDGSQTQDQNDELTKIKVGVMNGVMPVEMLAVRLRPITSAFS